MLPKKERRLLPCKNVRVIGHNPTVIRKEASDVKSTAIIWAGIYRISFTCQDCFRLERLGIAFRAFALLHAWSTGVKHSTWTMDHTPLYNFKVSAGDLDQAIGHEQR